MAARRIIARLAAGALMVLAGAGPRPHAAASAEGFDPAVWRAAFSRPAEVPQPADNPTTAEKVMLGEALFNDTRLSGDGSMSCATCHQRELSFSDGVALRQGHDGEPLARRTPSLWNLAWGLSFFWDGRAASLEAQASGPIENPREMAGDLKKAARELAQDAQAAARFALAFPQDPRVSEDNIRKALAAYERTLVSPPTRFDRWVEGDDAALGEEELEGLKLFVGKAGCFSCHSGWRFTDEAFHDIGLPGTTPDRGRGEVIALAQVDRAFKTPSLRERVWTGPYMHDGSVGTLEEAVAHYAGGIVKRPTLSPDLKQDLRLAPDERAALVAFLGTLSSEDPPRPVALPAVTAARADAAVAEGATRIGQKGRKFAPGAVRVEAGQSLAFVNDDTRTHQIRVDDQRLTYASGAQEPGETITLAFPEPGQFDVICGIHPEMRLSVEVKPRTR